MAEERNPPMQGGEQFGEQPTVDHGPLALHHLPHVARRILIADLVEELAHEINNALTPILSSAQLIGLACAQDAEVAQQVAQIVKHVQRIAQWTAYLQRLEQSEGAARCPLSLNQSVRDAVGLYQGRLTRMGIHIEWDLDENLPPLEGDPALLQALLLALLQQAVKGARGGALRIATRYEVAAQQVAVELYARAISGALSDQTVGPDFTISRAEDREGEIEWKMYAARQIAKAFGGQIVWTPSNNPSNVGPMMHLFLPAARQTAP